MKPQDTFISIKGTAVEFFVPFSLSELDGSLFF